MARTVKAVANRLLQHASRDRCGVDPLQAQKLVYLCQGWSLGLTGEPLFGSSLEAWDYGPVSPELYHSLKLFGSAPIRGRLKEFNQRLDKVVEADHDFEDVEDQIMQAVWEKYGRWSGGRLIELTHEPGSPWHRTRMENPSENDARIPKILMRDWFAEKAEEASLVNAG